MGKNFTKKLLPLTLTAAMIVPSVPAMAAPSDIAGHWAESVITQWQSKGLIQGYEDGSFKPNNTITRAEFVTLMNNAKGFGSEGSINFSDVKNGSWFYSAVARAVAAGYVKGYSDGSFKPGNTITRAEAAVMIANAARLSANEAGAYRFTDVGSIPAWARGSVGAVVAAGYMTGYPDGSFYANASISRAEAVSSLNRMLGGTAYQPTQPTTPTTSDDVVIEDKGTTLKNQTVDGNVTIAKSVGNGDVTLRNVTIKGDLIVKGGGSNTVTLEDVDVRGKVRLLKEGVHLHLIGDTDIRKLLIDLAARITQSSSYKDEIDEIILAGDGNLNKTTRIDVPAKQLRIENQADLILGGDVEKLIVDEDAKGAEIEIKKGTTVKELNTDAKIKLTGEGRIDLLDVSASGVTFDKNLDIRKKDTSNGATAPKENGSTSTGGSSTTSKEITGAEEVTLNVPYGEKTADQALAAIPKTVTLNLKNGKTISATVTEWKWADGEEAKYNATPTADTTYKATTTVTIPSGYTYNGTLTAKACVTVHPLDKTELTAALTAANAVFNNTTTDEKVAATDKEKILITDKAANAVTEGVRFTTSVAKNTLETAISNARDAENTGFASQKACKAAADALQVAITAFKGTIKIGTNTTTDAYILQQVKDVVSEDRNSDAPYSSYKQPLKFGYVYKFVDQFNFDNTSLHFAWEAQWKNQSETGNIGDYIEIGKDVRGTNAFYSLGAKVIKAPDEPKEVQFVVTVTDFYNKEIGKLGENGEYTATIGAPISAALQTDAPQFTAISDGTSSSTSATKFTGVVPITLNGANAITSVPNNCVTMANSNTESNAGEVSFRTITVDKVEKSGDVLNVTVSVTTGAIGGVWSENSPYPFKKGTLPNISINTSGFVLKTQEEGNPGWYLPTDNTLKLGDDMTVDVLTPAFTGVEHADDSATFTIQTQNMPENAKVEVALAKTSVNAADIEKATIKATATRGNDGDYSVTFDRNAFESGAEYYLWFRYGSPGSDWAYENVGHRPTYTFNNTTGGNESGGEGSQAGA